MIYFYSDRPLTHIEQRRTEEQIRLRSKAQLLAYDFMPECMRASVERDQALTFSRTAYFPDFLWRAAKVIIEIDGASHRNLERRREDFIKDQTCRRFGFKVIRILNEDVSTKVGFWQKLIDEFRKIEPVGQRAIFAGFIADLTALVEEEESLSTNISYGCNNIEPIPFFPRHTGCSEFTKLINSVRRLHSGLYAMTYSCQSEVI